MFIKYYISHYPFYLNLCLIKVYDIHYAFTRHYVKKFKFILRRDPHKNVLRLIFIVIASLLMKMIRIREDV